jgi:uncharacterized membrane protein (DUF485 family)
VKQYYRIESPLEYAGKNFFRRTTAFAWVLLVALISIAYSVPGVIMGFAPALLGSVLVGNAVLMLFFYGLGACDLKYETHGNVTNRTDEPTDRGWFFIEAAQWMSGAYIMKIAVYIVLYLLYALFLGISNLAILLFYWPREEK